MSKKIQFSVEDSEYIYLESLSNSRGKSIYAISKEFYELGRNKDTINDLQKGDIVINKNKILSLFEVIFKQLIFSSEVLNGIAKKTLSDDSQRIIFEEKLSEKQEEIMSFIKKILS